MSSLPCTDAARLRQELALQFATPTAAAGPMPWPEFTRELLALYQPPLRAKATLCGMRQMMAIVAELLGPGGTTADLTPSLIARFIVSRPTGESAFTTKMMLGKLRVVCNYAAGLGYCRVSPFALRRTWLRVRINKATKQRHHSIEDIGKALDLARHDTFAKVVGTWSQWRARRLYALVAVVAYTGLRKQEALRLRVEDIDIPGRFIHVVARRGSELKTDASAAPVPMPDALAAVLAEWLPHLALPTDAPNPPGPMPEANPSGKRDPGWAFPNAYRTGPWQGGSRGYRPIDRIRRLGARCGIEGFTFQSLRHSLATHMESKYGCSDLLIQRVLRHTTVQTQEHYRHADLANLRDAVKDIRFGS
jgi:integrase